MDDLTKAELDQLLAVFRDQSLQILEEMGQDLLALESGRADAEAMSASRTAKTFNCRRIRCRVMIIWLPV